MNDTGRTVLWNHPLKNARPGDIWDGQDQVQIDAIGVVEDGRVRIQGRIIRGYGRSTKTRSWTFAPSQTADIIRPQP